MPRDREPAHITHQHSTRHPAGEVHTGTCVGRKRRGQ